MAKPKSRKRAQTRAWYTRRWIIVLGVLVAVGMFGSYYYLANTSALPFDKTKVEDVPYTFYYPVKLPDGYRFQAGSDKVAGQVVFYSLTSSDGQVIVSEQQVPKQLPDLNLPDTTHVSTPNGTAIVGKSTVGTLVVLKTKTTLINMSGTGSVPRETLSDIIRAMRRIR